METREGPWDPQNLVPLDSAAFASSAASLRAQNSERVIQQNSLVVETVERAQQIDLNKACQIFASV